ncbi:hypothetical protein EROM_051630 [Encephalitozoon romaleae SJ-2008]|uniref:Uncharacterized protein n=1 Tax=Encephalitozoon romaleae (strain SJ-2008) TaxID=1178016 RepID=I6ZIP3_ENCRO|nr:hypothetical protein EROM_051630 [Encephalitozoon romaleae SJ-2008]AFN83093.1 hypothetical protein EROM_051630 [Encephalitozoon romaleae SJ-2008]
MMRLFNSSKLLSLFPAASPSLATFSFSDSCSKINSLHSSCALSLTCFSKHSFMNSAISGFSTYSIIRQILCALTLMFLYTFPDTLLTLRGIAPLSPPKSPMIPITLIASIIFRSQLYLYISFQLFLIWKSLLKLLIINFQVLYIRMFKKIFVFNNFTQINLFFGIITSILGGNDK